MYIYIYIHTHIYLYISIYMLYIYIYIYRPQACNFIRKKNRRCFLQNSVHLLFSFCIWTKNLTYISQLTSNNIIYCCKSHSELCPLKMATAETSWELLYRFYQCFPHYTLCNLCVCIYIYIYILSIYFESICLTEQPLPANKSW